MGTNNYHHGNLKNALIKAGVEILAHEGVANFSLRKVAKQAGVSHTAPYSHFKDKQALIAAISTNGFKDLHLQIEEVVERLYLHPEDLLVETAWAYLQFAVNEPDRFKLMFSSLLDQEKDHPDFVQISQENFSQLVKIVEICQQAGILKPGPTDLAAVSIWSTVHGFTSLLLEGQIPGTVLEKSTLKELLIKIL